MPLTCPSKGLSSQGRPALSMTYSYNAPAMAKYYGVSLKQFKLGRDWNKKQA